MNYSALRSQIYRHELKQLVAAIGQLGAVFAFLFINVLVPFFLMWGMLGVALIADKKTVIEDRIVYQAIYLILMYAMIKIQAKAILATPYRSYIDDLPITKKQHRRSDLMLTATAGNLVLFAPLVLCFFIPDLKTLWQSSFFVLFVIMVLAISQLALYRKNIPLLSLVLLPVLAFYFYDLEAGAGLLNGLWFTAVLVELLFIDKLKLRLPSLKVSTYSAVVMRFVMHRPVNVITRMLGTLVFIGSFSYIVAKRPDFDTDMFGLGISFFIALLVGSYQFEIERFRSQYSYYLNDLPINEVKRRVIEFLPLLLLSVVPALLSFLAIDFELWIVALQLALMLSTAIGVVYFNKFYFVAPVVLTAFIVIAIFV
jgi:hypothetical protein